MSWNKRPVLKIPLALPEKLLQLVSVLAMALVAVNLIISWSVLPEIIPTHFGASGNTDSWGGKGTLIFLPIVAVFLYIMLTILERFPHIYNYACEITMDNAEFQYKNARTLITALKTLTILVFSYIEFMTTEIALGKAKSLGIWFLPVTVVILACTLFFFIMRMRKNS